MDVEYFAIAAVSSAPPEALGVVKSLALSARPFIFPCLVKVGKGNNGYKTIDEFLPDAAE